MNYSRLLVFVAFIALLMCTTTAWSEEPDFADLSSSVFPTLKPMEQYAALRISGTLVAGQDDPVGESEYYLQIAGSKDGAEASKDFVLGMGVAMLRICEKGDGMKKGDKRSFKADLPMKWFERFGHTHLAFALMEKDHGLGRGNIDTVVLFLTGGAPDKVSTTDWMSVDGFKGEAAKLEFGPTKTGTHMELTLKWIPKPVVE